MTDSYTVSVVAPAYNEEASLPTLASRLLRATEKAGIGCELIIVDDGSDDNTWKAITESSPRSGATRFAASSTGTTGGSRLVGRQVWRRRAGSTSV